MNRSKLHDAARLRLDDAVAPYLWSEDFLDEAFNDAEREAATRAWLIKDSTGPTTSIVIDDTIDYYDLDPLILKVDRAKLDSQVLPIKVVSMEELDETCPTWEELTGEPRLLLEDNGQIRLIPKSTQADVLRLRVYRLPDIPMDAVNNEGPEIPAKDHYRLIDWVCRLAYLRQDADTYDEAKALKYEAAFERSFGVRQDANVARKQRENRTPIVQSSW